MLYRTLSAPITCQIELTTACNNSCIHCYNHWRHCDELDDIHMSDEILEATIREIIENKVFQVTLTGGEILLRRKSVFRALEAFRNGGVGFSINTNLIGFSTIDGKNLYDVGTRGLLTSICSHKQDTHDKIVRHNGAFISTIKGLTNAIKSGLSVSVSMVVSRLNVKDVVETGLYLRSLGVNHFFATKASPPLNSRFFEEYMISSDQLIGVMQNLNYLSEEYGMEVGILECYPMCLYKDVSVYPFAANRRCSAGTTTCTIGSDGSVRPCSHSDENYGNISSDGLKRVWERMTDFRDGSKLPSECLSCKFLKRCSGGCRVDAKYCFGTYSALDPYAKVEEISGIKNVSFEVAPLEVHEKLMVNHKLKIREEAFGVLYASISQIGRPKLVTMDTHRLIKRLQGRVFSPKDVAEDFLLDVSFSSQLCAMLMRDNIFLLL